MNLNVNIYLLPRLPELHYETINLQPGNYEFAIFQCKNILFSSKSKGTNTIHEL